jgi:hypothetical protein
VPRYREIGPALARGADVFEAKRRSGRARGNAAMIEDDGNADKGSKATEGEPPPLQLNPEIVELAAWTAQEQRGLSQITTRLVKRSLFWIEALALGVMSIWLYERLPALHVVFEQPSVIGQPLPIVEIPTDEE